jgi:hypothetical protein
VNNATVRVKKMGGLGVSALLTKAGHSTQDEREAFGALRTLSQATADKYLDQIRKRLDAKEWLVRNNVAFMAPPSKVLKEARAKEDGETDSKGKLTDRGRYIAYSRKLTNAINVLERLRGDTAMYKLRDEYPEAARALDVLKPAKERMRHKLQSFEPVKRTGTEHKYAVERKGPSKDEVRESLGKGKKAIDKIVKAKAKKKA